MGCASTRVKSSEDTLATIGPICEKIGVTRISDITFMDKLHIPNYSATLPETDDVFWVYGGKGAKKSDAKASALMEAIERYSSIFSANPTSIVTESYSNLSKSVRVLHPAEILEPVNQKYNEADPIDYLEGFDLLNNEEILVPAELAYYRFFPKPPAYSIFQCSHTNGLASGNVLEEAICHGLCEVIERDAISIADLCASCIPYNILEKMGELLKAGGHINTDSFRSLGDIFVDDPSLYPDVDIGEVMMEFEPVKHLIRRFMDAEIPLMIKDVTQKDIHIPTLAASCIEWITDDYALLAKGFGTHPNAKVALIRAIAEVSQTRAANIQGARDDLRRIRYREKDEIHRRKWPFMRSSMMGRNDGHDVKNFSKIGTSENKDILDDIKFILSVLKKAGIRSVIIVNLTNPDIKIPVVRVIVPGLETFEVTHSIMGKRAKRGFNSFLNS